MSAPSAPKKIIGIIGLLLGTMGIIGNYVHVQILTEYSYVLLLSGFIVLAASTLIFQRFRSATINKINMPKFVISKRINDEYQFNLKASNGKVILTSQAYTTKASCQNGIESVRTNSTSDGNFDRNKSSDNKDYFNLRAGNHQVIGTSEMYESSTGMETGIASVMKNAPSARIEE
jgi:uncharacterized protein YegP (UPF0339 family)